MMRLLLLACLLISQLSIADGTITAAGGPGARGFAAITGGTISNATIDATNKLMFKTAEAANPDGPSSGYAYIYVNNDRSLAQPDKANIFAMGNHSPYVFTTGRDNFFLGTQSGSKCTTCIGNLGIGTALRELVSGSNNTAIGWDSQAVNVIGNNNTSLGEDALKYVEGDNNVGLGYTAGYSISTGTGNVAIAPNALYNNQTGVENIGVGYAALVNTTNSYNTAVGVYAGRGVTTGDSNTVIGHGALASLTGTANISNVAVGRGSMPNAVSAVQSVAVGTSALNGVTTGDYNVALGQAAGYSVTTTNGGVFLGYGAGFYETGSRKLFIDSDTGFRTNEATARIQALIYGVFASTVAAQSVRVNGSFELAKMTDPATAPGADHAVLRVRCGTNAGTARLIVYAGTSTTPITITDNIGSGVTGC